MKDELSTSVMASLIKSKALAGSIWKSKATSCLYKIVGYAQNGSDVVINYRFCNSDYTGTLGEAAARRVKFLRNYELVKPI